MIDQYTIIFGFLGGLWYYIAGGIVDEYLMWKNYTPELDTAPVTRYDGRVL